MQRVCVAVRCSWTRVGRGKGRICWGTGSCGAEVMPASGGFPWTAIRVEDRHRYIAAPEEARADRNIEPFARFMGERVRASMKERE